MSNQAKSCQAVFKKIRQGKRISVEEAETLYNYASPGDLGMFALDVKRRLSGDYVFYNRNIHIEPTNICINHCRFCSYSRKPGDEGCWVMSLEEITALISRSVTNEITEVHIVGGVHPDRGLDYYVALLQTIHDQFPALNIKAFTAVELAYMFEKSGVSDETGLKMLKQAGLKTLPGGGAEIFDPEIRKLICPDKISGDRWLGIHRKAHMLGIPSNATMLFGHIENISHRLHHLEQLRRLQDETGGFNCFVPLKFTSKNNQMDNIKEVSPSEELKNYAISRIFLDNIPHLKAYWPMTGKETATMSLWFGVDDLDGTIDDSTRIYAMAGAAEQNPVMTTDEISGMISRNGFIPVERDSLYHIINKQG